MTADNVDLQLPSGAKATRADSYKPREYYIWSGNGHLARLTVADIEALYADSIAADGGAPSVESPLRCVSCNDWAPLTTDRLCGNCAS